MVLRSGAEEVHHKDLHDILHGGADSLRAVVHAFHAEEASHSGVLWSNSRRGEVEECGDGDRTHDVGYNLEGGHDDRNRGPEARIHHGPVESASDLDNRNEAFQAAPGYSVSCK